MIGPPPRSTLFPSTPLFRSLSARPDRHEPHDGSAGRAGGDHPALSAAQKAAAHIGCRAQSRVVAVPRVHRCVRSEEHTSELQSQSNLVCRLLLEKKNSTI